MKSLMDSTIKAPNSTETEISPTGGCQPTAKTSKSASSASKMSTPASTLKKPTKILTATSQPERMSPITGACGNQNMLTIIGKVWHQILF